jgi:chromosome segregation ATPase
MFTNSKKIAELQDALAKSTADIESFKAQIAALNEALAAKSKVKKAEDEDDEEAEDEDEEEETKKVKKAKAKSKKSEYDEDEEAEDEDEEEETKKVKKAKSKKAEDEDEDESARASIKALMAANAEMTETLKEVTDAFSATVEAAVTSTLAKMGIDPINVAKGNADGTKDKAPKSSNKGLSRAAELLNESLKNKNP